MTNDKARKQEARALMSATGERFARANRTVTKPAPPPWLACANCGAHLDVRIEGLFCSGLCQQTAKYVRYARRKVRANELGNPEIAITLKRRMAMILGGGYPESARRLSPAIRAEVIERDRGLCVLCGASGSEIDHIAGSSDDLTNLRFLCDDCHLQKTDSSLRPASAEESLAADAIWTERVLAANPTRLSDDSDRWDDVFREMKSARREHLLDELHGHGFERSDFPGIRWSEIWDDIEDGEAPEYGMWDDIDGLPQGVTEDEIGHHYYLQELAERD